MRPKVQYVILDWPCYMHRAITSEPLERQLFEPEVHIDASVLVSNSHLAQDAHAQQ